MSNRSCATFATMVSCRKNDVDSVEGRCTQSLAGPRSQGRADVKTFAAVSEVEIIRSLYSLMFEPGASSSTRRASILARTIWP